MKVIGTVAFKVLGSGTVCGVGVLFFLFFSCAVGGFLSSYVCEKDPVCASGMKG